MKKGIRVAIISAFCLAILGGCHSMEVVDTGLAEKTEQTDPVIENMAESTAGWEAEAEQEPSDETPESEAYGDTGVTEPELGAAEEKYLRFLCGEIAAIDQEGREQNISDYVTPHDADACRYAFYDMNGDQEPELCFRNPQELYFFTMRDGHVTLWRVEPPESRPLNNMAVLYTRLGGAPDHVNYIYYELGENGETLQEISFSEWKAFEEDGENHPAQYFIGDDEVSREDYEALTEPLLSVGDDRIIWQSLAELN